MAAFMLCGRPLADDDDESFQRSLADHYHNRKGEQPACLCQDLPIPLYIARLSDRYVLKRWPNTGSRHRYTCSKYEPPEEASGIGSLLGCAIKEEPLTGMTSLAVDFSLRKIKRAAQQTAEASADVEAFEDNPSGNGSTRKLTLKSILHYLWDKAEFCRWTPGMLDKRNWAVIAKHLGEVASATQIRQQALTQLLYIPPVWNQADGERAKARRQSFFASFHSRSGPKRLVMVLGEVKALEASQFGYRLVLKSMADTRIYLGAQAHNTFLRRYGFEFGAWLENSNAPDKGRSHHLVVLLTAALTETGALLVEDITCMSVNAQWLPYVSLYDSLVLASAIALRRRFLKPLTYNLGRGRTLPSVILVDTMPLQVNLFIKAGTDSDALNRSRDDLIANSRGHSFVWESDAGDNIYDVLEQLTCSPAAPC